jgi:hypothetical protein
MAGNIIIGNLKSSANQDTFYGIWNLTRAMKSAGWIYKASGNGTIKETTGNNILDTWGPGVLVQSIQLIAPTGGAQTGAAATIGTISGTTVTINGLTGMTASSVGHGLLISGAVNSGNNGTFTIIAYNSATSVNIWNPNAVSEATSLTWSERVSGTGASISSSTGDEAVLSGVSGLVVPTATSNGSAGHYITITNATNPTNNGTFRISSVISPTSCKIKNSSAIAESSDLIWVENNPVGDIYPQSQFTSVTAWINMQGPSTMKIPITTASTGTFVRGENVTQTSSGAQGELIGYLYDTTYSIGYLVIMPRVNGSGTGARGWDSTNIITGSISGATVPAGGAPIEFVREFVFWKNSNLTQGWIAYQCVDQNISTEGTSRFSYLAANAAGVTASVAPGGGGTSNTFPSTGTMITIGATPNTYTNWDMYSTTPSIYGHQHVIAANCTSTSGTSSDGTFFFVVGRPDQNSMYNSGFTFMRCDNCEDGDVDPYVWYSGNGGGNYAGSRTSCLAGSNSDTWTLYGANNLSSQIRGFRRRGFGGSTDAFSQFAACCIMAEFNYSGQIAALAWGLSDPEGLACVYSPTKLREPIFVISGVIGAKMRKGTMRWMYSMGAGNNMDTYDSKKWVQVGSAYVINTTYSTALPFVIGPWDGVTVPTQS